MLIYQKRCFVALTPQHFLPLYKVLVRLRLEYAIQTSLPILSVTPRHWKRCKIVKGLRNISPTASLIPPYPSADPLMCNIHVQDFPWSSEIPHAVNHHPSNLSRAKRLQAQYHQQRFYTCRCNHAFRVHAVPFLIKLPRL